MEESVKINPMAVCREEPDGTGCLFNPDSGKVFGLNATGLLIWKSLAEGDAPAAILPKLRALGAPEESVAADLEEFLAALRKNGMIEDEAK